MPCLSLHFLGETLAWKQDERVSNMFAFKYINRHFFLEHEGRLYLVDTGCPISFGINGAVPWANKTPHSVILDLWRGRLRFTGVNDGDPCKGTAYPYTKAPLTKAPMLGCHPEFKMIWDTGAQIGYVDMSKVPPNNIVKEMGPFVDFSPIYGPIESPMTWLVRFDLLPTQDLGQIKYVPYVCCQMAEAPQRIITDIRREGADGVLGNGWMVDREGVIITIKRQESCAGIEGTSFELRPNDVGPPRRNKPRGMDIFEIITEYPPHPSGGPKPDIKDTGREEMPGPNDMLTPVMRNVPTSLGAFTTEGLRSHIGLENIDGLIGNDLLLDTVL